MQSTLYNYNVHFKNKTVFADLFVNKNFVYICSFRLWNYLLVGFNHYTYKVSNICICWIHFFNPIKSCCLSISTVSWYYDLTVFLIFCIAEHSFITYKMVIFPFSYYGFNLVSICLVCSKCMKQCVVCNFLISLGFKEKNMIIITF